MGNVAWSGEAGAGGLEPVNNQGGAGRGARGGRGGGGGRRQGESRRRLQVAARGGQGKGRWQCHGRGSLRRLGSPARPRERPEGWSHGSSLRELSRSQPWLSRRLRPSRWCSAPGGARLVPDLVRTRRRWVEFTCRASRSRRGAAGQGSGATERSSSADTTARGPGWRTQRQEGSAKGGANPRRPGRVVGSHTPPSRPTEGPHHRSARAHWAAPGSSGPGVCSDCQRPAAPGRPASGTRPPGWPPSPRASQVSSARP